jgi:hypothetical protein
MMALFSIQMPMILAQAANGDALIDSGASTLFKILFLIGVIGIALGGWGMSQGNLGAGALGIFGGMIIALAAPIMSSYYDKVGMSSSKVKLSYLQPIQAIEQLAETKNNQKTEVM